MLFEKFIHVMSVGAFLMLWGCGDASSSTGTDTATDTNSDADSDSDTNSDSDTDSDTNSDTDTDSETDSDVDSDTNTAFTCNTQEYRSSMLCLPSLNVNVGASAEMIVHLLLPPGCTQVTQIHGTLSPLPQGVTLTQISSYTPPDCISVNQSYFMVLTASASGLCREWLYEGALLTLTFNVDNTTTPGVYPLSLESFSIGDNQTQTECRASSASGNNALAGDLIIHPAN
jgi:hypothetical protein